MFAFKSERLVREILSLACLVVSLATFSIVRAAEPAGAWTLDEARAHLKLYPRDAYVKYVALQLARREGKVAEVAAELGDPQSLVAMQRQRRDDVDLFSIFSGALAVQESLQLDAMLADQVGRPSDAQSPPPGRQGPRPIEGAGTSIKDLTGPTIKSHPWDQMLAGSKPQISPLARSVPDDFYFAEFRSVNKLTEISKIANLWGTHLFNQSVQEAETQLVDQRLREQLAVETSPLLAPFYDSIVDRIAIAGSDLFLREGSDVTLLFQVKQPAVFRAQMDKFLAEAAAKADAKRDSGTYQGVKFESVETPDRHIRVFSAYPKPDLHIRSNSRAALEKIIDAIVGHTADGKPVHSLGDTTEFAYIRTLLPPGAAEEDGLVYLSDPFMRHMVGPELRLTERRRLVCFNNLKMISHAALMYRTEKGKNATSLAELAAANCVPGEFGTGKLACPDGGTYTLADDGLTGVCSHHGYSSYLTPCNETSVENITEPEARAYRSFVEQYNNYWRIYFDPIAVRLTITPQRYRAETIVLPLIDNTVYSTLASTLGGKPEQLDSLPVPNKNIFALSVRLDKKAILHQMQLDSVLEEPESAANEPKQPAKDLSSTINSLKQIILATLNYESAHKYYPTAATTDREKHPLLSWRVEVLPFLEETQLYSEFHRNEPWDSEHNKALIARMPAVFRPQNAKLAAAGKTKFVVPRGNGTLYPTDNQKVTIASARDGTSRTIQIVEADDDHAAIWTKPDDLTIDAEHPAQGLESRSGNGYLVAAADGSVHRIDTKITDAVLAAGFTRAGRETSNWQEFDQPLPNDRVRRGAFSAMPVELVQQLRLGELISKGIGNQVSFNVYDSQQLFDVSLPKALGIMLGSFRGGLARSMDGGFLAGAFIVGSLTSPVYVSVPVKDREIVDAFLKRLDSFLVAKSHEHERGFFELERDFYQIPNGDSPIRAGSIGFGPVKWRFFYQRIGDAVYVASQRNILEDLAAITSKGDPAPSSNDPPAHALVRMRPQHWNQVLDHYHLGWEENNRQACLKNLGPLSSLSRAIATGNAGKALTSATLTDYTARLYDVRYFCPDDGKYEIGEGGAITCTKHGTAAAPRQTTAPAPSSELGKLLGEFSDMWLSLTFLDDGLHAIVDLERKK